MIKNIDDFDLWNYKKKEINNKIIPTSFHYYEREVWWCSIGKNIGSEENGKNEYFERPIIIFRIFGSETLWALPLTSREIKPESRKEIEIMLNNHKQTVDLAQIRLISSKRLLRYAGIVDFGDFQIIRKNLKDLI